MVATEKDKKENKVKSSISLSCIGLQGREIYNTFTFSQEVKSFHCNVIVQKFENCCIPRQNITLIRHTFFYHLLRAVPVHSALFENFLLSIALLLSSIGLTCPFFGYTTCIPLFSRISPVRCKFLTYKQREGQSFDEFMTDLKKLYSDCEFGELKKSLIKGIVGIKGMSYWEQEYSESQI